MVITKPLPSQAMLRELLTYNKLTGKLYWRERPAELFNPPGAAKCWNTRFSGKEAFTSVTTAGYCEGCIFATRYLAHRIIWKYVTGEDPDELDHKNGVRTDNRFDNLRNTTRTMNTRNRAMSGNNSTGVTGVEKLTNTYRAYIGVNNKRVHLGCYPTLEEAKEARRKANIKYGFTKRHGEEK